MAVDKVTGDVVMVGSWGSQSLSAFFGASGWAPADFTVSYGNIDGFVAKYTPAGNLVWAFKIGGANSDYVNAVDIDGSGNIYITGSAGVGAPINFSGTAYSIPNNTIPSNPGGTDSFVAKYSSAGLLQWIRYSDGVAGDFASFDVSVDNYSVYITGSGVGPAKFDPVTFNCNQGGKDAFVAKFDLNGNIDWVSVAGSSSTDFGHSLVTDNDNVYITGDFRGSILNIYDKSGVLAQSLTNAGSAKEDIFILSYTSSGSVNWAKQIASSAWEYSGSMTHNADHLFITGSFTNPANFPGYTGNPVSGGTGISIFTCSVSKSTGNADWVKTADADYNEMGNGIAIGPSGNVYVTGYFGGTLTFPGPVLLTTPGVEGLFTACYNAIGEFIWAKKAISNETVHGNGIAVDLQENIYTSGYYIKLATFDLITVPDDNSSVNIFLAKIEVPCTDAVGGTAVVGSNSICRGSSTTITLSGYQGTITWQSSPAGLGTWFNLPGEILPSLTVTPLVNTDYRAFLSSGTCLSAYSNIVPVSVLANAVADAGSGGNECDLDFQLQATPSIGTGTWTMTSGTGTASFSPNSNDPNSIATVTTYGTKEFTWTEVNGTCSNAASITVNFYQQPVANAGSGGNECDLDFQLQSTPSVGTGTWTMTSGTGTASYSTNANDPAAIVTVTTYGTREFTWTEVNGTCSNAASITVNFYQQPVANAGSGGNECDLDFQFQATPGVGTGTWTMTSGTGTASFSPNANDPNAIAAVTIYGTKQFTWTEVNGTCSNAVSITVNFYQQPVANAGSGGNECDLNFQLQATPSVGTGTWTMTSGTGTASFAPNANDPNAIATVTTYGTKEFTWTEVNGTCSNAAAITVNVYQQPVTNAGSGGNECDLDFQLQATPGIGTGTWTMTSGTGTSSFSPNANDPNATATVTTYGTKGFTWTEVNGTCSNAAAITVNFYQQPIANAGTGGDECDLNFQLQATPGIGTGTWTKLSGPGDASFSPTHHDPNSVVHVDRYGSYRFSWTEKNGICSAESNVEVNFYEQPVANATANDRECGLTAELVVTPSVGIGLWKKTSGPGNAIFGSTADISIRQVTVDEYGIYEFTWIESNGICSDSVKITITFSNVLVVNPGVGGEVCGLRSNLHAVPGPGEGYWSSNVTNSSVIFYPSANDPNAKVTVNEYGTYDFTWTETNGDCTGSSTITVIFQEQPAAYAGPDQNLKYPVKISLDADSPSVGTGIWKANINGATIFNVNDPKSTLSGLSLGENIFTWTVTNGVCIAATDEVVIIVNDIVTPTIITPNEDGFNDELIFPGLSAFTGISIIIYNRWGSELYRSDDYKNDWKGKDQKGRDLTIDTYYYILKISNGRIIKGFVEIRR